MTRRSSIAMFLAALAGAPLACADDDGGAPAQDSTTGGGTTTTDTTGAGDVPDPAQEAVDEARERFPTYLDLHTEVIARTCTPNMGVCHNIKEYPDLHTPQTMLGIIDQPCNLAESVPLNVYNGCEQKGDSLKLLGASNPGFTTEVGFITYALDDMMVDKAAMIVHLRDPIPAAMLDPAQREGFRLSRTTKQGTIVVGELLSRATYLAGESTLRIEDYPTLAPTDRTLLETEMRLGDPNQDGVFGGSADPYRLIVPGDPARSYLLQRLQGNVPGSPMPLANEPLSSAEVIALACWIEGITDPSLIAVEAPIDYDDCETAKDFGGADPNSGHSLSKNVQPILNQFCAIAGCHADDQPQAGLVLTPGSSRASLLSASTQVPDMPRVEPGNPTNSYLVAKLTGSDKTLGRTMPINPDGSAGMLEEWQLAIIRAWIVAGAPED